MASTNREFTYSSLNFDDIKEELLNVLKSDRTFSGYDFEGSGLNILTDLLAYISHMTSVTANISANEMFMDSAQLRQSIVSKAKELGYRPFSGSSPQARLKLTFTIPNTVTEKRDRISIPAGTKFGCPYDTVFSTKDDYVFFPTGYVYLKETTKNEQNEEKIAYVLDDSGQKIISHIIFEGEILVHEGYYHEIQYIIDESNPDQRFYIPSEKVDLDTLRVRTITGTKVRNYTENDNLNVLTPDSLVYFIHQNPDNLFEVTFGDGILGYKPSDTSVLVLNFIAYDKGKAMNGLKKITKLQPIDGTSKYEIEMVPLDNQIEAQVSGGEDMESGDMIRNRASRMWKTQNRAVTASDYETLLLAEYPWIDCATVWGGQNNNPPQYGKVFIAIKPKHSDKLAFYLKDKIKNEFIKKYNTLTCIPEIVDLDYIYVGLKSVVKIGKGTTTVSLDEITYKVDKQIRQYFVDNVESFNKTLYFSPLSHIIDDADESIIASKTGVYIEKRIYPKIGVGELYNMNFSNKLIPGTIVSSFFNAGSESVYIPSALKDDGEGNIDIWSIHSNISPILSDVGTVDYDKGIINLNFVTYALPESNDVKIYAYPYDNDIHSEHNQIIMMDKNPLNESWGIRAGLELILEEI